LRVLSWLFSRGDAHLIFRFCFRALEIFAVHCGLRFVHLQEFLAFPNCLSVSAFTRRNSLCTFAKNFLMCAPAKTVKSLLEIKPRHPQKKAQNGGMMEKKRSVGVMIFSVLLFILFLFSIWYFFGSTGFDRLFCLIMIITCSIASYGIYALKRWARILVFCIASLLIMYFVGGLILVYFSNGEGRAYFAAILYTYLPFILFGIASIYFFSRPKIKEQFK